MNNENMLKILRELGYRPTEFYHVTSTEGKDTFGKIFNPDEVELFKYLLHKGHFIRLSESEASYYLYERDEYFYGVLDTLKQNLMSITLQAIKREELI